MEPETAFEKIGGNELAQDERPAAGPRLHLEQAGVRQDLDRLTEGGLLISICSARTAQAGDGRRPGTAYHTLPRATVTASPLIPLASSLARKAMTSATS